MSDAANDAVNDAGLARRFRESARGAGRRAPLYRRYGEAIADDPEIARFLLHAPVDQRMPVLLYACVHWMLLREADHDLRRWYPNLAAPDPVPDGDPYPTFREFCLRHRDRLAEMLATRSTQTNEIGRCALLVPMLAEVARQEGPLAHLDVGASAGLNLLFDRYRYRYDGDDGDDSERRWVGPASPVEIVCGTRGSVPIPHDVPPVVVRLGIDRDPIDPTDEAAADWLRACVWPDQADRFARLDAALTLAAMDPPDVVRGDAVDDLATVAARLDPDAHLVVTDSWVLNYLDAGRRRAFVDGLEQLATTRCLTWCAVESPTLTAELPWPPSVPEPDLTHLLRVDWRNGRRSVTHLATAHPHGYWLRWSS